MRKKYIRLIVVFIVGFYVFTPWFLQIKAEAKKSTEQPAVCAWPSETMLEYFQFQKDVISAIVQSEAQLKTMSASSDGRLFSKKKLSLPSSALDYVVDNVWWRTSSVISTSATSVTLLLLASVSVIMSNTEWLAILTKDRPIVRDYKQMLDIETKLFNVAFTFSRKIDLTRSFDWNTVDRFYDVVKQYQKSWLLRKWANPTWNISMANILMDLISMNAYMKYFISVGWEVWASGLRKYAWCLWQQKWGWCNSSNFVLWFNFDAINKLKEEYLGTWSYWECNSYAANFRNSISKSVNNNLDSIKSVWSNDIKTSWHNLMEALIWKWTWTKVFTDPCEMTDYQRAQLDAYYWWDRKCWEWISLSSLFAKIREYERLKKTLAEQGDEMDDLIKESTSSNPPSVLDVEWDLEVQKSTEDRTLLWYTTYSGKSSYNPEFSHSMNDDFVMIFDDIIEQYDHSSKVIISSDLSYELIKIKWLVNQVDAAMVSAKKLEWDLQKIADYQCSM